MLVWDGNELLDFDFDMLMMNINDGELIQLEFYFYGNKIEKIRNKCFLINVIYLDFFFNYFQYVSFFVILCLLCKSKFFLNNNFFFKNIFKMFEILNFWNIDFLNSFIDCDCSLFRWVLSWFKVYRINIIGYFLKCLVSGNCYLVVDMDNYMYDCEIEEIYILVIIMLVFSFFIIFFFYLYWKYFMNVYVFYLWKRRVKDLKDFFFFNDVYIFMFGNNDYL